jgi:hypothetical protein
LVGAACIASAEVMLRVTFSISDDSFPVFVPGTFPFRRGAGERKPLPGLFE